MEIEELYEKFLQCDGITTDSRKCAPGLMFAALKGERFNGNDYVLQALEQGCRYAVTDEPERAEFNDGRILPVSNTLKALQKMALLHRRRCGLPVIGITGTNGKTTTKELVTAVLSQTFNVLATEGNLNNSIGVPLTVLKLKPEHQLAVVEMGASHPGDIKELVEVCDPDFGLITNVGMAHLQGFGSFEGVKRTKGELYDHIRSKQGRIFINLNNPHLIGMAGGMDSIGYSSSGQGTVTGGVVECNPLLTFWWSCNGGPRHTVRMNMTGSYNTDNALAAVTVGCHFGVPADKIDAALSAYVPRNNRSQITDTGRNRLVVDAYNANPTSMSAALDNFRIMTADAKMLILGDMRELGEHSAEEHQRIVRRLMDDGYSCVALVGTEFRNAVQAVSGQAVPVGWQCFDNVDALAAVLQSDRPEGRTILIKGSNSIGLVKTVGLL